MHELSIAQGIMANLRPWLDQQPEDFRVQKIVVKAGPFRAVVPEALIFAWEVVRNEHPKTEGSIVEVDPSFIEVECLSCGEKWDAERAVFKCPDCGSDELKMGGGNELFIQDIVTNDNKGSPQRYKGTKNH